MTVCYGFEMKYKTKYAWMFTAAVVLVIIITIVNVQQYFHVHCITAPNELYTHIIVGAGTAGCILAARLSENKSNLVLLIDAGSEFNIFARIPLLATFMQGTKFDWSFKTETQLWSSKGLFEQKQSLPRGKGLGGSGQINYLIHGFLNPDDLDVSQVAPDVKKYILKYYRELESLQLNPTCVYKKYLFYPSSGVCPVARKKGKNIYAIKAQTAYSELTKHFISSVIEANVPHLHFKTLYSNIYRGERWSTFHSHLIPHLGRSNLHVYCNAEVIKILFNKYKKAIAVKAINSGNIESIIYGKSNIILAAGTINSPKLLMMSGIGNSTLLKLSNISVVANLPGVGQNLHDHFNMPLFVSIIEPISLTLDKILKLGELWKYFIHRQGALSLSPIVGIVYKKSDYNLMIFGMGSTDKKVFQNIANYKPETFNGIFPFHYNLSQEGFVLLASCAHPRSRGSVKLNTNQFLEPLIDPRYFHNEYDIHCTKKAVKIADKLIRTSVFQKLGAQIHWPNLTECKHYHTDVNNEEYLECLLRCVALTGHHLAGTCSMEKSNDTLGVVDNQFRVKGVTNLRIVDASVLPTPVSTFPNLILVALAEYAASLINDH